MPVYIATDGSRHVVSWDEFDNPATAKKIENEIVGNKGFGSSPEYGTIKNSGGQTVTTTKTKEEIRTMQNKQEHIHLVDEMVDPSTLNVGKMMDNIPSSAFSLVAVLMILRFIFK